MQKKKKSTKNPSKNQQGNGRWRSVPFMHPSTFETISMEEDLKNKVKSDLESFLKGKLCEDYTL